MGGSNDSNNLVLLTHKEHFVAHYLLYRAIIEKQLVCTSKEKRGLIFAFIAMKGNNRIYFNSRLYEKAKIEYGKCPVSQRTKNKLSKANKGKKHTEEMKQKNREAHLGISIHTEESKIKIGKAVSKALKGVPQSEEHKRKRGEANSKALKGVPKSEEHKQHIREARLGIPLSEEHKINMRGPKHTKESKKKIGSAHLGIPLSVEHKENIRKAVKGSWEKRKKQL